VLLIWLFVVLIITSSYTANLTSILTVQQLSPTIQGISSLQASNVPIGYQTGSFARDYLVSIDIRKERLKPLATMAEYANALRLGPNRGGVAAVVDELPYMQVFLGTHCGFTIAGQAFTKGGWGFVSLAISCFLPFLSMVFFLCFLEHSRKQAEKWLCYFLYGFAGAKHSQEHSRKQAEKWLCYFLYGFSGAKHSQEHSRKQAEKWLLYSTAASISKHSQKVENMLPNGLHISSQIHPKHFWTCLFIQYKISPWFASRFLGSIQGSLAYENLGP
jgi:hypothetical protein